ncbi:hypothetical protein PG997_014137, partial [Apiospora hydei]
IPLSSIDAALHWEDCSKAGHHALQCSKLDVPIDHFNTSSVETFTIPLIRMIAHNASATGDRHIIFNPGGPGASGVRFLRSQAAHLNNLIGEGFHLLSFDPRGVGGSEPPASCYSSQAERADAFTSNPWDLQFQAGEMYTRAENKARACRDRMGEYGEYVNTPQTAADMNSILDAIGQRQMYYWGVSYGTILGQTYAHMFPDRVSRLVIDGVGDLEKWYSAFNVLEESFTDTDQVFTGFAEECSKAREACPLNTVNGREFRSTSRIKTYIDEFLGGLDEEPIPVYLDSSHYGSITRRNVVSNGVFPALYRPASWPSLANNLAALFMGNSTPAYLAYSKSWVLDFLVDDSSIFVMMNDNQKTGPRAPLHGTKPILNHTLPRSEMSYLVSRYQGSGFYEQASWSIPTTHGFRPRYYPASPRVRTAEPMLILSTTWDPVCPLASAKKARASFEGARLVEQKAYGHSTRSMPSLCTAKYIRRYFNEGELPEPGATCNVDVEYFPASGSPSVIGLSNEDKELLVSLQALADETVFGFTGHWR